MKAAVLFALALIAPAAHALDAFSNTGAQGVNFWRLKQARGDSMSVKSRRATSKFPQYNFTQPLDHFASPGGVTFEQRYWVSTRHYNASSPGPVPVIVLDGGESDGEERLPFLDTGIVDILTKATGGVGVVLEHRYYGESVPVQNFSTDSLRWLNNDQAFADSANFMQNIKFPNITRNLSASHTPWIYYGGSYAGARSAYMRVLYPNLVYGAIASSGVVEAILSMWQYNDAVRLSANQTCMGALSSAVATIDSLLARNRTADVQALKGLFGLAGVVHNDDFASTLQFMISDWQGKNWDPAVDGGSSQYFDDFCAALLAPANGTSHVKIGGVAISQALLNYGSYVEEYISEVCPPPNNVDDCFSTYGDDNYSQDTGLDQTWRLWNFQVCTQWGFFSTAPPDPSYPRIVSNLTTLPYASKICQQAYPPGEHFAIPAEPDVASVNKLGGWNVAADRLAFVDGQYDPWRPATAHSVYGAQPRKSSTQRPYYLIPGAVHHWDENGLANSSTEPSAIKQIHAEEVALVTQWLSEWKGTGKH